MKQRDLLKGRVKRLLKEQKDMGQVAEGAALCCSSAVQVFVRDLANKMQQQAVEGVGLTPIELKKSVLASGELNFLHEKVNAIDESDAKYHKPARGGGKKRTLKNAANKATAKKARTAKAVKSTAAEKTKAKATGKKAGLAGGPRIQNEEPSADKGSVAPATSKPKVQALNVEEDDDYDESDSDA